MTNITALQPPYNARGSPFSQKFFKLGSYAFISQDPAVISPGDMVQSVEKWLPNLIATWMAVERATGFRWKCTSYIRNSPTHKRGQAIDLAPDWTPESAQFYATTHGSDPVLYKREWLIRRLQSIKDTNLPSNLSTIGIFIEPDHLHVQVLDPRSTTAQISTIKWEIPKPIYGDTYERMALPLFRSLS